MQCKGFLSCGRVAHQYLPQCDSTRGMMCGDIVSHCVQWLFGVAVEFLSCGSGLRAPPELQYLPSCAWGLCRWFCSFDTRCSSRILAWLLLSLVRASSHLLQELLYLQQELFSLCDVLVNSLSTCGGGNLSSFGGGLLCHCDQ